MKSDTLHTVALTLGALALLGGVYWFLQRRPGQAMPAPAKSSSQSVAVDPVELPTGQVATLGSSKDFVVSNDNFRWAYVNAEKML